MFQYDPGTSALLGALLIISGGILFLWSFIFLLSLYRILNTLSPSNRTIKPANVFLLLIPVFNSFYQFIVVVRVSISLKNEFISRGMPSPAEPMLKEGLIAAVLTLFIIFYTYLPLSIVPGVIGYMLYLHKLNRLIKIFMPAEDNYQLKFEFDKF